MRIQEKGVASPRQNSKIAYSCGATGTTTDKENVNDGAAGVGYSTFVGWARRSWDVPSSRGSNSSQTSQSLHYNENQQAVIEIAKEYNRGITEYDANTLVKWADEYNLVGRGPEIHRNRSGWGSTHWHIHIGPINHIWVTDK